MAELEVCYSSLAEMHAYELITPISKGKNVFISLWLKPHQRVELFFFFFPLKCFVPLVCDTLSYSALIFLWPSSCDIFYIYKNCFLVQPVNQISFFAERKHVDV